MTGPTCLPTFNHTHPGVLGAIRHEFSIFDREDEIQRLAPAVLALVKNPAGAKAKAAKAREFVRQRQREMTAVLGRHLPA